MRIYVDVTEPGSVVQPMERLADEEEIPVVRTLLHKRPGSGGTLQREHPFYGRGADYVVADDDLVPHVAFERKTTEDLARSLSLKEDEDGGPKIFRQLRNLRSHPSPTLLLEGRPSPLYYRMEPAILGLQYWCHRQGIMWMYSTSPSSTGRAIFQVARKLGSLLE